MNLTDLDNPSAFHDVRKGAWGPALFLFDIDGTMLRGGTEVHRDSFAHIYKTVYGLALSLEGIAASGRTDTWLLAEPLRRRGLSDESIQVSMPLAFARMAEYVEKHLGDLKPCVLPGVRETLTLLRERGELLGLLTGNLTRIAYAKLAHAGLSGFFGSGGFGEESEIRAHLVPVAVASAAHHIGYPIAPERVVIIGDTPMDIEAGQVHGARTVGVATGYFSVDDLCHAGADLVLATMSDSSQVVKELLSLIT